MPPGFLANVDSWAEHSGSELLGSASQARGRLAAFTAGAWPGLPNLLASHHLQGLLRLDAGAAPGMGSNPQVRFFVHHCQDCSLTGVAPAYQQQECSCASFRTCASKLVTPAALAAAGQQPQHIHSE